MATNQHFERGTIVTPIEEQFVRLGFDYTSMLERGFYARNDYALFMDTIRLKDNPGQEFHHEVRIEFGVYCTEKRQPFAINHMTVKLKKFDNSSYEGQQLDLKYYPPGKGLPTKDQISTEMLKVLDLHVSGEREAINQAQKIYSNMNDVKQAEPNPLKRRL